MIDIPKGYRELRKGEYLEDGDLYYSPLEAGWVKVRHTRNYKYRIKYNPFSKTARHVTPIIRKGGNNRPNGRKE
jgi:hypothetical protein